MSMETNGKPTAPFQQWQNFYPPYAFEPKDEAVELAAINNEGGECEDLDDCEEFKL